MEEKEVLERVINIINPKLKDALNNLKADEVNYFIEHLALDLEMSLSHWRFKKYI